MATKKQKREEMAARRAEFEAETRQNGLRAQARDREYRARKAARAKEEADRENQRLESILATAKMKKKVKGNG